MNRFSFRKQSDSFALFSGGQRLFAGSSYEVRFSTPEFRADRTSLASLLLVAGDLTLASCSLSPDQFRRDVRTGTLDLPDNAAGQCELRVVLGSDTILLVDASVTGHASGGESGGETGAGSRWTVVNLGSVPSGAIAVADMTQVSLTAPVTVAPSAPLSITPSGDSLDAYVVVSVDGTARFPFTDVLVNGAAPTWSHKDSLLMPAHKWVIRLVKVAGDYYADLRAGRPAGTEVDPDGAHVVSSEVNS